MRERTPSPVTTPSNSGTRRSKKFKTSARKSEVPADGLADRMRFAVASHARDTIGYRKSYPITPR